jgi:hypothetical protein
MTPLDQVLEVVDHDGAPEIAVADVSWILVDTH